MRIESKLTSKQESKIGGFSSRRFLLQEVSFLNFVKDDTRPFLQSLFHTKLFKVETTKH